MHYYAPITKDQKQFTLTKEQFHHISRVKRLKNGDLITFINGKGSIFQGKLTSKDKAGTIHDIELIEERSSSIKINLWQSNPKKGLLEQIIQKTTELGITSITPIITERTVANPKKRESNLKERYEKVIVEACKQSENPLFPIINEVQSFNEIMEKVKPSSEKYFFLSPTGHMNIKNYAEDLVKDPSTKEINYIIGPEGGFCDKEVTLMKNKGFSDVSYGKTILRTETAAIAVMAILRYHFLL